MLTHTPTASDSRSWNLSSDTGCFFYSCPWKGNNCSPWETQTPTHGEGHVCHELVVCKLPPALRNPVDRSQCKGGGRRAGEIESRGPECGEAAVCGDLNRLGSLLGDPMTLTSRRCPPLETPHQTPTCLYVCPCLSFLHSLPAPSQGFRSQAELVLVQAGLE